MILTSQLHILHFVRNFISASHFTALYIYLREGDLFRVILQKRPSFLIGYGKNAEICSIDEFAPKHVKRDLMDKFNI